MTTPFDSLIEEGLAASQREDVDAAIRAWYAAAALDPTSALPHFLVGAEFAQNRRMAEAEAAFANAVLLAPALEVARYQLGLLQFTSGRTALAQLTWAPLFGLGDRSPLGHFVHGFSSLARDEFEVALDRFAAGMAANVDNAPMNADISAVVAAIRRIQAPAREKAASADEQLADDAHVLLAAYQRQRPMH